MSYLDEVPTSFIVETNKGGMPITICSCGVLMFKPMAAKHFEACPAYWADRPEADPNWCASHCVVETPGTIRCGECFHWWADDASLLADDIAVRRQLGQTRDFPTVVGSVYSCPYCTHDF